MTPHVIRLRGPWQCQPLARVAPLPDGSISFSKDGLPSAAVVPLPGDWVPLLACPAVHLSEDFRGLVRLSRRFTQLTGLTPNSRVYLAIEEITGIGVARVNGRELGAITDSSAPNPVGCAANLPPEFASSFAAEPQACPARWEIGPLLADRNEVTIDVLSLAGGSLGLVSLEIEEH